MLHLGLHFYLILAVPGHSLLWLSLVKWNGAFLKKKKCRSRWSRGYHTRRGSRVVDLQHVKEPQAEVRASEQYLSDFSCSVWEVTLMT